MNLRTPSFHHELDAAERARALAGRGTYGGGYAFAGESPVIVVDGIPRKTLNQTDADRIASLERQVADLKHQREALRIEVRACADYLDRLAAVMHADVAPLLLDRAGKAREVAA